MRNTLKGLHVHGNWCVRSWGLLKRLLNYFEERFSVRPSSDVQLGIVDFQTLTFVDNN